MIDLAARTQGYQSFQKQFEALSEKELSELLDTGGKKSGWGWQQDSDDQAIFIQLMKKMESKALRRFLSLKEELLICLKPRMERILGMFRFFGALRDDPAKRARYPKFLLK